MKLLIVLVILFCIGLMGYDAGLRHKLTMEEAVIERLTQKDDSKATHSLNYAISVVAEEEARASTGIQEKVTTVEKTIEKLPLSQNETDLHQILGSGVSDTRMWHALIAERHAEEVPGAHLFVQNFRNDLLSRPAESTQVVGKALDRIPASSFPLEKAALLLLMDEIPGASSEAKSRGLYEMMHSITEPKPDPSQVRTTAERNLAMSTTEDMLLPVVAQSVFLKNTEDAMEALGGTVQGIVAQQDRRVRSTMAAQFVQKYPDLKGKLTETLNSQGVQIPMEAFK